MSIDELVRLLQYTMHAIMSYNELLMYMFILSNRFCAQTRDLGSGVHNEIPLD